MKIFLIGYMGSGKSFFGRKLAECTGLDCVDMDERFEQMYRISIHDFFRKYGEEAFRLLESKLLSDLIDSDVSIISTGGGTPCFRDNIALMKQKGTVIYLELPEHELLKRLTASPAKRPVLQYLESGDLAINLHLHLEQRKYYYHQADIILDGMNPDIRLVLEIISSQGSSS